MKYISLFIAFLTTSLPLVAAAAGLVPCGGEGEAMCGTADFVALANNIMSWLVTILSIIAVMVMMVSGFEMVTSGGDVAVMSRGKERLKNVIIGIFLVLGAWLIIDQILKVLTGIGLSYWGSVQY